MKFIPGFPICLEHTDGSDKKTCWFQCQNHLDKYMTRSNLKISDVIVEYEDPRLRPVEKPKRKTESKITKTPVKTKQPKQLFSSLEQFFDDKQTTVETVGKVTRRKSTQKRSRS